MWSVSLVTYGLYLRVVIDINDKTDRDLNLFSVILIQFIHSY